MMKAMHKKAVHKALVDGGYKKTHATKLVKGMADHAKNMGFKVHAEAKMAEGEKPSQVDKKAMRNERSAMGSGKSADKTSEKKYKTRGRPKKSSY